MYAKRSYRPRRKILRRRRPLRRKSSGVSGRIKKYVKREIHRNIENKEKSLYAANWSITTSDINTCTYGLIPSFAQGTNTQQRVGSAVKIVSGKLDAIFNLLPYNLTTNPYPLPVWVKIWICRDLKYSNSAGTLNSNTYNAFFRTGNGTQGMQGTPLDMVAMANSDLVRILTTRTFKLGCSAAITQTPIVGTSYLDTSPMSKKITINWGKYVRKVLKFDESSDYATNENLFIVIQCVSADGQNTQTKTPIEWHWVSHAKYEDA